MNYRTGLQDWTTRVGYRSGLRDWTTGLNYRTELLNERELTFKVTLGLFQTSCYCRAEPKLTWLGSGTAIARQRFQTSNLIQSHQIQKTKQTIHPTVIYAKNAKYIKLIYELSSARQKARRLKASCATAMLCRA